MGRTKAQTEAKRNKRRERRSRVKRTNFRNFTHFVELAWTRQKQSTEAGPLVSDVYRSSKQSRDFSYCSFLIVNEAWINAVCSMSNEEAFNFGGFCNLRVYFVGWQLFDIGTLWIFWINVRLRGHNVRNGDGHSTIKLSKVSWTNIFLSQIYQLRITLLMIEFIRDRLFIHTGRLIFQSWLFGRIKNKI